MRTARASSPGSRASSHATDGDAAPVRPLGDWSFAFGRSLDPISAHGHIRTMDGQSTKREWAWKGAAVLGGATGLGLLFGSRTFLLYNAYPDNSITFVEALAPSITDWYLWAALVPPILWACRTAPFETGGWRRAVVVHVAFGVVLAILKFWLDLAAGIVLPWMPSRSFARTAFLFDFFPNLLTYWVLIVAVHAIDYGRRYQDRALRASQLETALAQVQLQVLRMQLQPHFLFNTLNAVTTLMHRDVPSAERMLVRLSDLLRSTIEKIGVQDVSLREELAFLRKYLEIEETRFPDRLTVEFEIDADTMDACVPHLILQPLVENSIRHGVEKRSGPGRIRLSAVRSDGALILTVEDEGPGLPPGWAVETASGLGLRNVRERLERLYGEDHQLHLENRRQGGVVARVALPFRLVGTGAAATGGVP